MMVSMALLAILAYVLLQITVLVATANTRINGGVNSFQDAAVAFDTLTKTLSQATVNTYIDYYPSQLGAVGSSLSTNSPSIYIRQSELHFICGQAANIVSASATGSINPTHAVFFQAPLGFSTNTSMPSTPDLLNACGFYINFGTNSWIPSITSLVNSPSNVSRYRLMELLQPSENLGVYTDPALATNVTSLNTSDTNQYQSVYPPEYDTAGGTAPYNYASPVSTYNWITTATTATSGGIPSFVRPLADNVIALIVEPMLDPADQTNYFNENIVFPTGLLPNNNTTNFDYSYDTRRDTVETNTAPYQQLEQNQLPPMMQVTMVAIDEPSAIRLAAKYGTASPNLIVNAGNYGPNTSTPLFTQTANYAADLQQLTAYLASIHVNYRVFTAQVPMFNAKWTTQ
jgi:uncharacterized protein (TIGR02599 family)